jgi:hypothetical protein
MVSSLFVWIQYIRLSYIFLFKYFLQLIFIGVPLDFYNWNKVYARYCDGASFSGDGEGQSEVILLNSDTMLASIIACGECFVGNGVEWNHAPLQRIAHL